MQTQPKEKKFNGSEVEKNFPHSIFVPYDPEQVGLYTATGYPFAVPYEYTGWRDETMAWKETCYLHGNLNPSPTFRIKGPEALRFLSDTCVNTPHKFPIGTGKHGIMCNDRGQVMQDGVMIRVGEDEFITYWMAPYMVYALMSGKYDAAGEDLTGKVFLFQIGGPRSLEVLEAVTGECLHDIKFMHHRMSSIDGMDVRVLRMGMAGSLAYEVHGSVADARPVYEAIVEAGKAFGLRKLGIHAYMMNHTENGFPQATYHFPYPWGEDENYSGFLKNVLSFGVSFALRGSMGSDIRFRYRNPVELGWGKMIKFDHDFTGRKALEKEVTAPTRKMVTLEWNLDDIVDVFTSQFRPGEAYPAMDTPNHFPFEGARHTLYADQVLKNGVLVGISSGRAYSYHFRKMISLCSIDVAHSVPDSEVTVLWGDTGTRQKEIRAKVSRFPYLNENRNQKIDVNEIPCVASRK